MKGEGAGLWEFSHMAVLELFSWWDCLSISLSVIDTRPFANISESHADCEPADEENICSRVTNG